MVENTHSTNDDVTVEFLAAFEFEPVPGIDLNALPGNDAVLNSEITFRACFATLRFDHNGMAGAVRSAVDEFQSLTDAARDLIKDYKARIEVLESAEVRLLAGIARVLSEEDGQDPTH